MSVVIDACVALKWVIDEPGSDAASALRQEQLIAPAIWLAEAANVLWRRVRIGDITPDEATARLGELRGAPLTSLPIEPVLDRASELAIEIGHPVHDCFYVALVLQYDTYVVTADRRFAAASALTLTRRVRLLGA